MAPENPQLQQLINAQLLTDQDDIIDGKIAATLVCDLIYQQHDADCFDSALSGRLIELFNFQALLSERLRALSTGETRKLMLIKALSSRPEIIVLDEPFDGLDVDSVAKLNDILTELSTTMTMIFVVNRLDEIPDLISHYGYVVDGQLQQQLIKSTLEQRSDIFKLLYLQHTQLSIPLNMLFKLSLKC
ncbi:hypothetical protein HH219_05120 [Pseudoalteromonas sp. NEC-BIFX-2020_015]|uniref:ATP-binding cassette domain-containing protein n=1 Tax=Pseudoalteromonas sp. NEC-BIFX-2020_015 TaxID=2729544 RepID=UPI0014612DFB|nr:hypothetical protein [Pseudoalteromonas sp. NEC-BIFX-2020_015]NMR24941.1 hypothetical protein [Pseudoalteromonas sp. NEC-BIFX-2020_015]